MKFLRQTLHIFLWTVAWGLGVAACLAGFGIDGEDAQALGEFCKGVERWQSEPDFRQVADEYVRLSHAAMNSTPFGIRATNLIMAIRSIPGLGPKYAVSPTSQAHYDDFSRGELSAYLHLCGEQTMDWAIRDLQGIAQRGADDADVKRFLDSWHMNRPVISDAGAIAGVKRLLVEIDPTAIETKPHVAGELQSAATDLASRLGYSNDARRLMREQEHKVFERLDADIRVHNVALWRQKQISDLCCGIWAQTFGGDYVMVIAPTLAARKVGRIAGPVTITVLLLLGTKRIANRKRQVSPTKSQTSTFTGSQ
jgi:hypothetical protein